MNWKHISPLLSDGLESGIEQYITCLQVTISETMSDLHLVTFSVVGYIKYIWEPLVEPTNRACRVTHSVSCQCWYTCNQSLQYLRTLAGTLEYQTICLRRRPVV